MHAIGAALAAALAACGGGSPAAPGGGGGAPGAGAPGPSGATVTIANGRVTPASVTVTVGQSVTFVNNDGRVHNVSSDPHPAHTNCTALNIGNLSNGQTRLTGAFTTARTCTYHDHDDPDNANLKGTIVIQ
jgi:plastocyanin